MSDWIHALPVGWMAAVMFGGMYLISAGVIFGLARDVEWPAMARQRATLAMVPTALAAALQAICTLVAVAMVHSDNRRTMKLALWLFSTAVAVCIVLIAAHDRPFMGQLAVTPMALLQAQPDSSRVGLRP